MLRRLSLFLVLVKPTVAQTPPHRSSAGVFPPGVATTALLGVASYEEYNITTVGVEFLEITERGFGTRFAIATIPELVGRGAILADLEFGPGFVSPIAEGLALVPYGGLNLDFAVPDPAAVWGGHVGIGLLARAGSRVGMRLLVSRRWIRLDREFEPFTVLAIGFGALAR